MDKIIVVGMSRKIPVKAYVDEQWQFDKMFRFRETQSKAEKDFDAIKNSNVQIRLGYDKRKYMTSGENEVGQHKILQTYSFGSLGRGIDFAEYDLIDVNASIYKPISAYVTDDPDAIKQLVLEDRANTLTQNIGRILRRSKGKDVAIKIVVAEMLETDDDLKAIAKEMSSMSRDPVDSWWAPDFLATEEVCEWLTKIGQEHALPVDLPRNYRDLIERAAKLVAGGADKKSLKRALRWEAVRKSLASTEASEVEAAMDELLDKRDPSVRKEQLTTDEKTAKTQDRRMRKILDLMAKGQTPAQIRSNMKVRNWTEVDQSWFDSAIDKAKETEVLAAEVVESLSQSSLNDFVH